MGHRQTPFLDFRTCKAKKSVLKATFLKASSDLITRSIAFYFMQHEKKCSFSDIFFTRSFFFGSQYF